MRNFLYIFGFACVIGLAYWAYTENYATQAANKRVQELQLQIAAERAAISVLRAEWAYLNRPERLRELADMNFQALELVPLAAQHFGETETIAFPARVIEDYNEPVSVQGELTSTQSAGEAQ